MKIKHKHPDALLLIMMKLSIFFLLCLAIVNAPGVKGQTIHLQSQQPLIQPIQQKVQRIYTSQIGIREKGINTGTAVEQYLRYVNLPKGNPWCAAFVCWVYGQAGVENPRSGWSPDLFRLDRVIWTTGVSRSKYQESRIKFQEPRIKNQESRLGQNAIGEPRTRNQEAGTKNQESRLEQNAIGEPRTRNQEPRIKFQEPRIKNQESRLAPKEPYAHPRSLKTGNANASLRDRQLIMLMHPFGTANASASLWDQQLKDTSPQTGDIFALYFPEKKRIAHVGFIDQWDGTWLISVEGNTNVSGSIEGDGVYRKRRLVKSIYKVARYINY